MNQQNDNASVVKKAATFFGLSGLVLAFSFAAQAAPAVGQKTIFAVKASMTDGRSAEGSLTKEYKAYDTASDTWTVQTSVNMKGEQPQTSDAVMKGTDVWSDAKVQDLMKNCTSHNGKLETIVVPAGSYSSCHLPLNDGGSVWLGDVPFGVIKIVMEVPNQYTLTLDLTSIQAAAPAPTN